MPFGEKIPLQPERQRGVLGPKKSLFFPLLIRLAWERLLINTDLLLIITSNADDRSGGTNIDDLETTLKSKNRFFWLWRTFEGWIFAEITELDHDSMPLWFNFIRMQHAYKIKPKLSIRTTVGRSVSFIGLYGTMFCYYCQSKSLWRTKFVNTTKWTARIISQNNAALNIKFIHTRTKSTANTGHTIRRDPSKCATLFCTITSVFLAKF